jgi:monoamine oxidase
MKTITVAIFIVGAGLAGLSSAQAMPVASLDHDVKTTMAMILAAKAKACKRGYKLTPKGCRRISW